jgi:hypothetical protein
MKTTCFWAILALGTIVLLNSSKAIDWALDAPRLLDHRNSVITHALQMPPQWDCRFLTTRRKILNGNLLLLSPVIGLTR